MEVLINSKISLCMETVDLLYAYVNHLSPSILTSEKSCGIPADEISRIMEQVCVDLDRNNWMFQFYFQSFPVDNLKNSNLPGTCVAYMLLYSLARIDGCDFQAIRANLHSSVLSAGGYFEICGCSQFGLSIRSCREYRSVAMELQSVDVPDGLRLRLAEALSNYPRHIDLLCDLLEPIAEKLGPLLEPWWEKTLLCLDGYRTQLSTDEKINEILAKINIETDGIRKVYFFPRIFSLASKYGMYDLVNKELVFATGAANMISWCANDVAATMTPTQVTALRLLSNLDRINMLRAMSDRVMTPKEITQELGLKPGAVFRDLNNLYQSHLAELVVDGIHRSYKTDLQYLRELLQQLYRYIEKNSEGGLPLSLPLDAPHA